MAGEIQVQSTSGTVVYSFVYDSNGNIYNGSSFEVWVDGNILNYDISMAEQGTSGFYIGDFPIVAEGIYSVVAKRQAGGTPSTADILTGAGNIPWDGSGVVGGGGGSLQEFEINVGHSSEEINVNDGPSSNFTGQQINITKGNESTTDPGSISITKGVEKV